MGDKRNPMACLINVGFVASKNPAWLVPYFVQFLELSPWRATVISRKNKERIISNTAPLQSFHNLPHVPVDLLYEIAVFIGAAFSFELINWQNRRVRTGQW